MDDQLKENILSVDRIPLLTKKLYQAGPKSSIKDNLVTINVSGRLFVIDRCYLEQYPTTLLGSPEIENYWDPRYNEYFFDTHRDAFESIFDFYLYGKLYPHPHVPAQLHHDNVEFFKIMSVFEAQAQMDEVAESKKKKSKYEKMKGELHSTLEDPNNHIIGKIYGWADLFFIFLSIATMLVETIPSVNAKADVEGSMEAKLFYGLETATVAFFTFDVVIRGFAHPSRCEFFKSPATWLDICTIAPFYIELLVDFSKLESMKVLRIARVARVLKLIKKNKRLQLIAEVLMKSVSELCMLVIVWAMNITVAGVVFYYLEEPSEGNLIRSGVDGMWWAIVTMSTVG